MTKAEHLERVALLLLAWCLSGCERPTHVGIEGGTVPVFLFSGSGELAIFVVYGPDYITKAQSPSDESVAVWKIKATGGYFAGMPVEDLEKITYGVVPDGYIQVKPQVGSAPPLLERQTYVYWAETTNAPGSGGAFEVREGRAVPTNVQGPCFESKEGKWVRVPCLR